MSRQPIVLMSSLPTIVVAGNQSSGKSSLIEAISGVSVYEDHRVSQVWVEMANVIQIVGTCTRVPVEVRLRQDDIDWSCAIKVRREGSDQDEVSWTYAEEADDIGRREET